MPTIINRNGASAIYHAKANATCVVVGGVGTSNIASTGETITSGAIAQVWWGSAQGHWVVKRGSNTVLVLDGSGYLDFAGTGASLTVDGTATIEANCSVANCFIMLEVQKTPTIDR
jgi:hypothetical protein